jgi:hypothetical protein
MAADASAARIDDLRMNFLLLRPAFRAGRL